MTTAGDIICAMMIQAVITTERQTEQVKIRVGHSTMHFGMPIEISPTDSWLSEEHQMIHIHSVIKKLHAAFLICFVVLALFEKCLNFYLFILIINPKDWKKFKTDSDVLRIISII